MMRATALVVVLALSGCAFAVEHPAATAGILGGTLGFGTCEVGTDFDGSHGTCALVGGGAAALLGGVVLLAVLLGGEGNTVLTEPDLPPRPEPPSIDDPQTPPPAEPAPAQPATTSQPAEPASAQPTTTPPAPTPAPTPSPTTTP